MHRPIFAPLRRVFAAGLLLSTAFAPVRAWGGDSPLTLENFEKHVRLHASGVDQIGRAWWRLFVGEMLADITEGERRLAFDLLAELGRIHDVSKWGARWRFESPFRPEFERLEAACNAAMGRTGNRARVMRQGSDFLFDFLSVDFKDPAVPAPLRSLGEEVRLLLNDVDAAAVDEVLGDWRFVVLSPKVKARILGAISLADLTHRYLSSRPLPGPQRRDWASATRLEFGRAMKPVDQFLGMLGNQGKGVPGLPKEWTRWYPVEVARRHGRALSEDEEVIEIVARTTLWQRTPFISFEAPCRVHFIDSGATAEAFPRARRRLPRP